MSKRAVAWLIVVAGIVTIAGGLGHYKYAQISAAIAAAQATPEAATAVEAVRVRRGEWTASAKAIGTVVALRQVEIRNELAGTVVEVGFASGDTVNAGQVLVRFDTRQERAALAAAEAEARLARLTLERREGLRGSPAFSAQDLDRAREEHAAASARVMNLKAGIEKKTLVAPFRARVGLTDLQPGAYLDAGSRIAMLQGVDADAYVDFSLPQDSAVAIGRGATVELSGAQLPGHPINAKIVAVDDSVEGASRAVRFRAIAIGLGEVLRPGTFVDVVAATAPPRPTLLVPLTAVRRSPYGQHVYVLQEEEGNLRARQRVVKTGAVVGEDIAVSEGLREGALIAAAGSFKLRDGVLVRVDDASPGQQATAN